jgi:hypothetical protein
MEEIMLANAALAVLEKLLPVIQGMAKRGEVSAESQMELQTRYQSLRNAGDAAFEGPEWQRSGR